MLVEGLVANMTTTGSFILGLFAPKLCTYRLIARWWLQVPTKRDFCDSKGHDKCVSHNECDFCDATGHDRMQFPSQPQDDARYSFVCTLHIHVHACLRVCSPNVCVCMPMCVCVSYVSVCMWGGRGVSLR